MTAVRSSARGRLVLVIAILVAAAGIARVLSKAQASPPPPVTFNHRAMVQAGITCLFCHTGATRVPAAGIPGVEECTGCPVQQSNAGQLRDCVI